MDHQPNTKLNKKEVFLALTDDSTSATVLLAILLISYGDSVFEWDILDILFRLEEDFNAQVTEENESKLHAIILAVSTDVFYQDLNGFKSICRTLTTGDPGFELADEPTLLEILWGNYEVEILHGDAEFTPQIETYIADIIDSEGRETDETDDEEDINTEAFAFMRARREAVESHLRRIGITEASMPPIE